MNKKLNHFEKQAHYCCARRRCVAGENSKGLACSDLDFSQNQTETGLFCFVLTIIKTIEPLRL